MEVAEGDSARNDLPVLLIDVYEIPLEALIHLRREAVPARRAGLVVEPEQDLKKDHLQAVFVEKKLPGEVVLRPLVLLGRAVARLVLVYLYGVEDLGAHDEELVSLVLVEGVDDQALPQDVDLGFFQGLAV